MKRVIVVGTYAPFEEDPGDAEIWGVNRTYLNQRYLDRLYFLDPVESFGDKAAAFVTEANALDCRLIGQRHYPEIPASEAYPLREVVEFFGHPWTGDLMELSRRTYFTSTIAYMIAHAIVEGFEKLTLHRINANWGANDYFAQKCCLDFWIGLALGRGIRVYTSEDSLLGRPVPWEPGLYGYVTQSDGAKAINMTVAGAIRSAARIPVEFFPAEPLTAAE